MLTNEIVLKVFADYLKQDKDYEVVLTSRGYALMQWEGHRDNWESAEHCPTPKALMEALLSTYSDFLEMKLTGCERDLTSAEKTGIQAACDFMQNQCEQEAKECSS